MSKIIAPFKHFQNGIRHGLWQHARENMRISVKSLAFLTTGPVSLQQGSSRGTQPVMWFQWTLFWIIPLLLNKLRRTLHKLHLHFAFFTDSINIQFKIAVEENVRNVEFLFLIHISSRINNGYFDARLKNVLAKQE